MADSGTFVVRHAGDTVATETFSREETSIHGTLALNNFKHTFHRYTAVVAPDASVPMIDIAVREDADSGRIKARLLQRARVIFREDSAAVDAVIGQAISTQVLGTQPGAIPYLNMSFALLEQAVRRSRAGGGKQVPFFNLAGGQTVSWDSHSGGQRTRSRWPSATWSSDSRWIPTVACWAGRDSEAGRPGGPALTPDGAYALPLHSTLRPPRHVERAPMPSAVSAPSG